MNNLHHTIRKFNRFELKYLITIKQAALFKESLKSFVVPDDHGHQNGIYHLSSLYYDSPDLLCYWEKMDGLKYRRKLRIRVYENDDLISDESPVFVEIKQRIDRITQKRRVLLPYRDAIILCNERQIPQHQKSDHACTEEIYAFLWQYNLQPATIIRYTRQAFIGSQYDIGLRITFDSSLTGQRINLHLHESPAGLPILNPNWVVMEIKVNERIPYWLTELVGFHNLQMVRISKYCRCIDVTGKFSAYGNQQPHFENANDVLSTTPAVFNFQELQFKPRK